MAKVDVVVHLQSVVLLLEEGVAEAYAKADRKAIETVEHELLKKTAYQRNLIEYLEVL